MRFRAVLLAGVCLGLNPFEIVWGQGPTITFNIDHVKIYPPNLNDNQTLKTNVVVRNPVTFDLGMSYVYKRVPPYSDFTASATFTLTAPSGSLSGQRRTYGGRDYYVLDSPTTFQITSDYTSNSGFPEDTFSVFMAGYVGDGDCQLTPRKTGLTPSGSCTFQYIPISRPEDRGDDSSQPTYLLLEGRITPLFSVVNDLYFSAYFNPQPTDRISIDGSQAAACGAGGAASRDPLPRATPVCYPDSIDGVQVVWDPRRDPRGEEDPLVYKKSAILRVFLDSNGANDVTSGISGQITTPNTTFNLGIPNTQVNKGPVKARADKTAVLQDIDGSLNFLIQPKDQIGKGPSKFHIDVLQNGQVQASKDVTLYFDLPQIYPAGSKPIPTWPERLAIGYFLFCPSPTSCPANPPDGTTNFANNIFPLRDHGITFTKILDNQTWTQQISPVSGSYQPSAAWKMTKTMLLLYTLLDLKEFGVDQLIAWAPASLVGTGLEGVSAGDGKTRPTTKEDGGLGHVWWMEAPESFAVADVWGKELAHALAHNLGLADVSAPIGPGAFDVINYAIPTPDTESLMASLVGGWPSKEQYADIYTGYMIDPGPGKRESLQQFVLQIASPSPEPSSRNPRDTSPSGYIVISGDLSQDGSIATFDAGFNVPSATAGSQSDPYGSHCLRFGSDSTNDYCFNPVFLDSGNTAPAGGFAVKAPLPAGTNSISLIRRDGTGGEAVLTTLKAAPDPPSLTILSPHNGDTLMGRQTLQWTATDPGGLPLTYALQYSSDNGASWTPLTFPTTDTQYPIDSASMVGPQVMIRVLASNGLQTTTAVVGPLKLLQSTKVDVSTTTLDFGTVSPATGSVEQSFSITSSGTGPFKPAFQIAGDAGFQVVSPATVIWPGKQSTVTVQVDPGAATSGRATLSISTPDATQTPVNVQLTATISGGGSGTPSVSIVAKPATLDFGSVSVRQKSTPQTVTITNSGSSNAALTLTASAGFTVTPATLTVNGNSGTGTASVTFAPATAGAQQGTLTITASASSVQSVTVNLTGTGTSSGGGSSSLQFLAGSPEAPITSYDFGTVAVNQTKDVVIKLLNNGSAGGNFNLSIDNPRFIVSTGTLGAGSNGGYNTFGIRFAPTDASAQTGTLTVTGFGQTATLSLKGNSGGGSGGTATISVTVPATDFGTVNTGSTKDIAITIASVGTRFLSVTPTISPNPPFSIVGSPAALSINAGTSQTLTVRFSPTAAGAQTGTLTLVTDDLAHPTLTYQFTGSSAAQSSLQFLAGSPEAPVTSYDFGTVAVNQTKDVVIKLLNNGSAGGNFNLSIDNPRFIVSTGTLGAGSNGGYNTFGIRFAPTDASAQTGMLTVTGFGQTAKLSLKGNSGGGGGGSCSGSPISTTLTVTGSGTSSSGNISASGPLTLSGVGTGTFSSNFSLASAAASGSVPVTFTVSSGSPTGTLTGTLTGSAALLAQVFAGNPSSSGAVTITITGGTGSFAGATGTFNATASGNGVGTTGSGAGNFKLSGAGTINLPSSSCGSGTPTISVTVPVADFGTVNTGATKDLTVTIASTGTSTLSVTPTMAPNPPFSILGSPAALSINAGTNQTLTIRFSPTAAGVQTGTLNLVTDDQAHKNLTFQFTGTGVTPAGACVAPPANIVSWWAGDGNANDLKGGNNGTLQSGGSYASGQVAQAFSFDGANGYVRVGDPANLRLTSALTIEGWIYPRALASGNGNMSAIVTKWAQNFSIVSDADSWGFWLRNNNGSGSLFSGIHVNSGGEPNIQGGSVPINAWSHVAVTFDSATGRHFIYLNGQVVASGTPNLPLLATSRNILIGREDSSSPRPFNGLIDELSVYSRALGAAEIQSIYQAGSAGKCK